MGRVRLQWQVEMEWNSYVLGVAVGVTRELGRQKTMLLGSWPKAEDLSGLSKISLLFFNCWIPARTSFIACHQLSLWHRLKPR